MLALIPLHRSSSIEFHLHVAHYVQEGETQAALNNLSIAFIRRT